MPEEMKSRRALREEGGEYRRAATGSRPQNGKRGKKRSGKGRGILRKVILVVFLGVFLYSGYQVISISGEYSQAENEYRELETLAPTIAPVEKPVDRRIDFDALAAKNPDIVGWISIPGTVVDYPVVRGTDNDYYLSHTFGGGGNSSGAIFVDCANSPDFSDRNTVIYGHHMKNGSMFAALIDYKKPDYFKAHDTIRLYTPTAVYEAVVFSVYVASPDGKQTKVHFDSDEAYLRFIDGLKADSMVKADVPIGPEDRIITLSTCSYEYDNARTIVHAVLRRIDS